MWDREIACPDGPLPGAVLDVLEHRKGWFGRVQLVPGRSASDIGKAAAVIEEVWNLVSGSVVVDSSGSSAELWVHDKPSSARHHRLRPLSGLTHHGQRGEDGLYEGQASHLQAWANLYAYSYKAMRGGLVDMERFLRRLARLEAGLTDWAHYAEPGVLAGIVEKAGLPHESLSKDVAEAVGMQRPSSPH